MTTVVSVKNRYSPGRSSSIINILRFVYCENEQARLLVFSKGLPFFFVCVDLLSAYCRYSGMEASAEKIPLKAPLRP